MRRVRDPRPAAGRSDRALSHQLVRASTVESALPEPGRSTRMPAPLHGFYDLIRRWPDAIVQNVVLAPPELPDLRNEAWAETYIDDGKLAFYVENQGVCRWRRRPKRSMRRPSGYAARHLTAKWIRGSSRSRASRPFWCK